MHLFILLMGVAWGSTALACDGKSKAQYDLELAHEYFDVSSLREITGEGLPKTQPVNEQPAPDEGSFLHIRCYLNGKLARRGNTLGGVWEEAPYWHWFDWETGERVDALGKCAVTSGYYVGEETIAEIDLEELLGKNWDQDSFTL